MVQIVVVPAAALDLVTQLALLRKEFLVFGIQGAVLTGEVHTLGAKRRQALQALTHRCRKAVSTPTKVCHPLPRSQAHQVSQDSFGPAVGTGTFPLSEPLQDARDVEAVAAFQLGALTVVLDAVGADGADVRIHRRSLLSNPVQSLLPPDMDSHSDTAEHPLMNAWRLYAHGEADATRYNSAYNLMTTMHTCEDWGRAWSNLPWHILGTRKVAKVYGRNVQAWSLFKEDTSPAWEHPDNICGTTLSYRTSLCNRDAEHLWTSLVVECVRGAAPAEINGVLLTQKVQRSVRLRYEVWLRQCPEEKVLEILEWIRSLTSAEFVTSERHVTTR